MFSNRPTPLSQQSSLTPGSQHFLDGLGFFGWQLGLDRIEKMCKFFGQPQLKYPTVHIAGTNGKGSTAAMLAAIGKAAGLRTGLYTSPHLVHLNERIQIDGAPVSFQELEEVLRSCKTLVESLQATYFEVLTVIAFEIFAQRQVDWAIIETGLGGRLDATNVVQPEATVITTIGLEHQKYLGRTLGEIAGEKAGIIKKGIPCISGVRQKTARQCLVARCRQQKSPFFDLREYVKTKNISAHSTRLQFDVEISKLNVGFENMACALSGCHQIHNAALAILTAVLLREKHSQFDDSAIRNGLQTAYWPARLQVVQMRPAIVVDAAHNADGMRVLAQNLQEIFKYRRLLVVMGLLDDKTLLPILRGWKNLHPRFFFATPPTSRARPARELALAAKKFNLKAEAFGAPAAAFAQARDNCREDDLLCITGSHYLIGALMRDGCIPLPYHN
jgi:dihydrofolate synthase/folylpolyglutamate synthase